MEMEVKLHEAEVREAVMLYLKQKHGLDASSIKIVVGDVSVGYGPTESTKPGFKYVECKIQGAK